jgi:hypothetical protein
MGQKLDFFRSVSTMRLKMYMKQCTKYESVAKLQDTHAVNLSSNDHLYHRNLLFCKSEFNCGRWPT